MEAARGCSSPGQRRSTATLHLRTGRGRLVQVVRVPADCPPPLYLCGSDFVLGFVLLSADPYITQHDKSVCSYVH